MALLKLGLGLLFIIHVSIAAAREGRISIFQVIEFPNDECKGNDNRNGTCYTEQECENRGGKSSGSCAEGYGVCCVQTLECGETTSDNSTYLMKSDAKSTDSPCTYRVCPCNENICRIRYDFMAFTIAGPSTGTTAADPTAQGNTGGAIGDCLTDTFSVSGVGVGSPVICGVNTGYHMIIDAPPDRGCQMASFTVGSEGMVTRMWDVKVTQYGCGNMDSSGPPGCLQYYTGVTGDIESFNFPQKGTNVVADTTHLSNQRYSVCIRREANMCAICYTATEPMAVAEATQGPFGVSVSTAAAAAKSAIDTRCTTDFIEIPGGVARADATAFGNGNAVALAAANIGARRLCGRKLNFADDNAAAAEVCSSVTPFRIGVNFNGDEATDGTPTALNDERDTATGGIVGFRLAFTQVACT